MTVTDGASVIEMTLSKDLCGTSLFNQSSRHVECSSTSGLEQPIGSVDLRYLPPGKVEL
ncbi:hypothetical protein [Sulfuracidifex tepidarius]|nr:hypothetical protein [Sulfuracidifex tepidarius]